MIEAGDSHLLLTFVFGGNLIYENVILDGNNKDNRDSSWFFSDERKMAKAAVVLDYLDL